MPGLVPGIGVFTLAVEGAGDVRRPPATHEISLQMKARVTVTLKTGILDPQGKAIEGFGARRLANLRWHDLPWNYNAMKPPCELRSSSLGAPDPSKVTFIA